MPTNRFLFNLRDNKNPTFFNLNYYLKSNGWQFVDDPTQAIVNENTFDFDANVTEALEFKHRLASLTQRHCPEVMPLTFGINDNNWPHIIKQLEGYWPTSWILKPALLNNGQHIKLFKSIAALKSHYQSPHRLGGEHVIQEYIQPQLLRDNRKYSIRNFIILTNYGGAYCYNEGYFNIALTPYSDDYSNLQAHLTNEHLNADHPNSLQIPCSKFSYYQELTEQIMPILSKVFKALRDDFKVNTLEKPPQLAIFGFDFMVDNTERLWLLEANHGPCFPVDFNHPMQTFVYQSFWQQLIINFLNPIAQGNNTVMQSPYFQAL